MIDQLKRQNDAMSMGVIEWLVRLVAMHPMMRASSQASWMIDLKEIVALAVRFREALSLIDMLTICQLKGKRFALLVNQIRITAFCNQDAMENISCLLLPEGFDYPTHFYLPLNRLRDYESNCV